MKRAGVGQTTQPQAAAKARRRELLEAARQEMGFGDKTQRAQYFLGV